MAVRVAVLSFWATTDRATVDKLRVYRGAYEVSVLRIARFAFATATNINREFSIAVNVALVNGVERMSARKSHACIPLYMHYNKAVQ